MGAGLVEEASPTEEPERAPQDDVLKAEPVASPEEFGLTGRDRLLLRLPAGQKSVLGGDVCTCRLT